MRKQFVKSSTLLAVILSIVILVSSCVVLPKSVQFTVTDALDRSVSFEAPPERIVIAGRANFMLNDTVYTFPDAADKVVALTKANQATEPFVALLDEQAQDKLVLTFDASADEIAAQQPDVVLMKSMMKSQGDALEALGIPVVYLDFEDPSQYQRDLAVLGALFGDVKRAQEVQAFYKEHLDAVASVTDKLPEDAQPTVLVLQYNNKGENIAFQVPPVSWMQTQMVTLAGGTPVWLDAAQNNWAVVNLEQIAAWNPDQIYIISYFAPVGEVLTSLKNDPTWQVLRAVEENQLYGFPRDYYSWDQPDTRWILGLRWMAATMHPDQYPELDVQDMVYTFYGELYGLDAATVDQAVMPLMQVEQ